MGGELQVKSTPGQGSTFWFDLDFTEVEGVITSAYPERSRRESRPIVGFKIPSAATSTGSGQDSELATRKILIADDNHENRIMLKDMLLMIGFEVVEAVDGCEVIDKTKESHPDLILMDLVMPEMDGFEATRQIRQIPALSDVIIIAVSASAFEQTRQESFAAGCIDFLAKPIVAQILFDKLQTHLKIEWIYEDISDFGFRISDFQSPQFAIRNSQFAIPNPQWCPSGGIDYSAADGRTNAAV